MGAFDLDVTAVGRKYPFRRNIVHMFQIEDNGTTVNVFYLDSVLVMLILGANTTVT